MHRLLLLVACLSVSACGARTLLAEDLDAGTPPDAGGEPPADARRSPCPLTLPEEGAPCEPGTSCVYISPSLCHPPPGDLLVNGVTCFTAKGGWVSTRFGPERPGCSCSAFLCSRNVESNLTECIADDGTRCCTCSPDGLYDKCDPC